MSTIFVVRAFGGVLLLNVTPALPPVSNVALYVRSGRALVAVRSGHAEVEVRR